MPISYQIDKDLKMVFASAEGVIGENHIREYQGVLANDSDFEPDFNSIFDLTDVTQFTVTGEGNQRLAHTTPFTPEARRAYVAPEPLQYGMSRMYAVQTEPSGQNTRAFKTMAEARKWLGLKV